jgi:DNA-binding HxlR family transcriptional regulator
MAMQIIEKKISRESLANDCPVQHALQFIGGKWRIGILWSLKDGSKRFGELKRDVLGISEKMLIQELKRLGDVRVIKRKTYPEVPPRVEYSLTERGKSLMPLVSNIISWSYADMGKDSE